MYAAFHSLIACENYKVERQRHNKQTQDSSQEKRTAALQVGFEPTTLCSLGMTGILR